MRKISSLLEEMSNKEESKLHNTNNQRNEIITQQTCLATEGTINLSQISVEMFLLESDVSSGGLFTIDGIFNRGGSNLSFLFVSDNPQADRLRFTSAAATGAITTTCPALECDPASSQSLQATGMGRFAIGNGPGLTCAYILTLCVYSRMCSFSLLLTSENSITNEKTEVFRIDRKELIPCGGGITVRTCPTGESQCTGLLSSTKFNTQITFTPPVGEPISATGNLSTSANINADVVPTSRSVNMQFGSGGNLIFLFIGIDSTFQVACSVDVEASTTEMLIQGSGRFIFGEDISRQSFILTLKVVGGTRTYDIAIGENGAVLNLTNVPVGDNDALFILSCEGSS